MVRNTILLTAISERITLMEALDQAKNLSIEYAMLEHHRDQGEICVE
jgi:hypothetical protein